MKKFFGLALFLLALSAQAAPVTWTLDGVVFANGNTATGAFNYDADTNIYSEVSIQTSGGGSYGSLGFSVWGGGSPNITGFIQADSLPDATDEPVFILAFTESLTNTGGTIALSLSFATGQPSAIATCSDPACQSASAPPGLAVTSGSVTAVPLPAAVWLFGSALAGLGWMRRKQIT